MLDEKMLFSKNYFIMNNIFKIDNKNLKPSMLRNKIKLH